MHFLNAEFLFPECRISIFLAQNLGQHRGGVGVTHPGHVVCTAYRHPPAELLHCAHIDNPVMKVLHEGWHILIQKAFVCMH